MSDRDNANLDQIIQAWLEKARQEGWLVSLPDGQVAVTMEGLRDLTRLRLSL